MTNDTHKNPLTVSLLLSTDLVTAEITDRRPATTSLFGELTEPQRDQLALDAWSIGLRSLANAHAQAQEARLKDVGTALIEDIDRQLRTHVETQQKTIAEVLARFFDPKDGQVTQRLAAFVDDQGALARLLDKFLAPQHGVMAQTLARQVGESSPLFRRLSPTDSEGLIKTMEAQLAKVMNTGHSDLVKALDPQSPDGAVARFLRSLREELKGADADREKQLTAALTALDANDEGSLISRLSRETEKARLVVLKAVNPDAPDSPMASIKTTLVTLLKEHAASQTELLRHQQTRQEQLEKEIREALGRIEMKRSQEQRAPRGGHTFEAAVMEFLAASVQGAPCVVDATSNTTGILDRCKKGDAVVRFSSESAFAGAAVVFEAKHDIAYTAQKALEELDLARRNRDAKAGVFVMARTHAPAGFPRFARYGCNVLVTWDDADIATDPYLHAAIYLGMALVTRTKTNGEPGEIGALRDIEARIETELKRLDKMDGCNDSIRKNADLMGDELRKARKALDRLIRDAQSTLRALNLDLYDEDAERLSPITIARGSLQQATRTLAASSEASAAG